jgi:glucan-binding YG repeat protein
MKLLGIIGTTGLFLLLGTTAAAYAPLDRQEPGDKPEKQDEAKPEKQDKQTQPAKQEAKPAKQEQDKPAKEEAKPAKQEQDKPAKQDAKEAKQEQKQDQKTAQQSPRDAGNSGGGDHGRISDAHYQASFGSGHNFHVSQGEFNNHRFSYGGYSFGFIDPWPVGWFYTDNVYVVYDDGGYYMCDAVHPGIRLSINIL